MVFCSLFRCHKFPGEMKFFQSAYPYLNHSHTSSLTKFKNYFYTRFYIADGPHPSQQGSRSFLGIDHGHYGVYFTIFNHDGDRKKANAVCIIAYDPILSSAATAVCKQVELAKFYISKLNQDIVSNIIDLKSKSHCFLSTSALVRCKRAYSTSTKLVKPREPLPPSDDHDTFAHSQIEQIQRLHATGDPAELNLIYPIYQALKRNDIVLPSVDLYNTVLESILRRQLDSEMAHDSVERRLTNLLTVYQDLLNSSHGSLKPNATTYSLVLNGLLDGSLDTMNAYRLPNVISSSYTECYIKTQEFCLLGVELLLSIKNLHGLDLHNLMPKLLLVLNAHPNLINPNILRTVNSNIIKNCSDVQYHVELIKLTKHLRTHELLHSDEQCYDFILSTYNNYTTSCDAGLIDASDIDASNYSVYAALIQALIETNNFNIATQFLDTILIDFKESKTKADKKLNISNLISTYLNAIEGKEAYGLVEKFNSISYMPELSIVLYNGLINKLVDEFYRLEATKTADNNQQAAVQQREIYQQLWNLVDYNIVRHDFKLNTNLVGLAADLHDKERVFKITKYILTNDELIQDSNVFKRLLSFYCREMQNGQASSAALDSHLEAIFNLVEHQSKFFKASGNLSSFVTDIYQFIPISNGLVSNFTFKSLTNSPMIFDLFQNCNLSTDNLIGLVAVSQILNNYTAANQVSDSDLLKVMHLQSFLINEFESPEVVYLNLEEDLQQFKAQLTENFIKLSSRLNEYTESISEAFRNLDIEIQSTKVSCAKPDINLNLLLNINYDMGVDRFVELFKQGASFNHITLMIIINKNFLMKYVLTDVISVKAFVKMLVSDECADHLLAHLAKQNLDKINIQVMKQIKDTWLAESKLVMDALLASATNSDNRYLHRTFKDFTFENTPEYFKYLETTKNFDRLAMIFNENADIQGSHSTLYLKTLLNTRQLDKFNAFIKENFHNKETVSQLLKDDELKTLVNEYYLANNIAQQLPTDTKQYKSVSELSSQIFLQLKNEEKLTQLVKLNAKQINLHQQAILYKVLTKLEQFQLGFSHILKFCKVSGINKLSVNNFMRLISVLTETKEGNVLSIILSKFINGARIAEFMNFYFMEVLIVNSHDKLKILSMLRDSFSKLGDVLSVKRIDNFIIDNKLVL